MLSNSNHQAVKSNLFNRWVVQVVLLQAVVQVVPLQAVAVVVNLPMLPSLVKIEPYTWEGQVEMGSILR